MTSSHPRGPCHPGQAKVQLYRLLETLAGVMMLRGPPAYVRSITGRSSSLWPCVNGSPHSNSQPAPSSTAAPGQTAILLHRDGLPPPISCQSPGAPVHPLIPDDAMSVSNQPASTALNSLGFLKWLCNAGWSRPCVGTVVRHLEPLAIKAGLPEDNLLSRRT
jgi:hypothetical protein